MLNKKIIFSLSLLFFCSSVIAACGQKIGNVSHSASKNSFMVYSINNDGTKVVGKSYEAVSKEKEELVRELLSRLSTPPEELGLKQAIPDDVQVVSYSIEEDVVTLSFSEAYHQLTGISEVLRRASVVKTLCQIEDIRFVKYLIGEQPLLYSDMVPVGLMKADDFIDNSSGETTYYQTVHLNLFYTDEQGEKLVSSRHNVEFDGTISLESLVLKQLINGPLPEEKLKPVLPEGTKINKVSSKDGICYVDFSKEFLNGIDGVSNQVIIYSVVNSLSEIGSVTKVVFTVDGASVPLYREDVPIDIPIERKLEIIETR